MRDANTRPNKLVLREKCCSYPRQGEKLVHMIWHLPSLFFSKTRSLGQDESAPQRAPRSVRPCIAQFIHVKLSREKKTVNPMVIARQRCRATYQSYYRDNSFKMWMSFNQLSRSFFRCYDQQRFAVETILTTISVIHSVEFGIFNSIRSHRTYTVSDLFESHVRSVSRSICLSVSCSLLANVYCGTTADSIDAVWDAVCRADTS